MPTLQLSLHLLAIIVSAALAEPDPGRVPKVYNALISSNQNLEPSKAYPVYQPVIQDAAFAFPFHPAFYYGRDIPLTNGLVPVGPPAPGFAPNIPAPRPAAPAPESSPEPKVLAPQPSATSESENKSPTSPPPPPNTESPIPLNEFGLPPQVLPLGKVDPYRGFNQVIPYSYSYPGLRFYDPYDPYNFNPYLNFPPVYRPLTNEFNQGPPAPENTPLPPAPESPQPDDSTTPPPSDASDLNVLNYSSKDPSIPNVPPPPLPEGGLKSDKE